MNNERDYSDVHSSDYNLNKPNNKELILSFSESSSKKIYDKIKPKFSNGNSSNYSIVKEERNN